MNRNYEDLANAIVLQAYEDYKIVLIFFKENSEPFEADSQRVKDRYADKKAERKSIESFFRSGWYRMLTSVDADIIMKRAVAEVNVYERKRIS